MRDAISKLNKDQSLFFIGISIFVVVAVLGWNKLQYGFNFIDEGMYMADSWRMAAGDRLFPDNSTSVVMLFTVFNALIFDLSPDISLLSFRKIQYFLTLLSIAVFGLSVYRWTRVYWHIPFVMSVYAFTGLDAVGMSSNMSYYTYPHLFLILYISFLIFGLNCSNFPGRNFYLIISGLFLWGIGFSLLPLSIIHISPVIFWLLIKSMKTEGISFSAKDLMLVITPGIILWLGFLAYYNIDFVNAALDTIRYNAQSDGPAGFLFMVPLVLEYMSVVIFFAFLVYIALKFPRHWKILTIALVSGLLFAVIDTNLFGLVNPYWKGWFNLQMWISAFLIMSLTVIFVDVIRKLKLSLSFNRDEQLILIILIPTILYIALFSTFSTMNALAILYAAIPASMGISIFILNKMNNNSYSNSIKAAIIIAVFTPYYYHLAWADWKFTYFDLSPKYLTYEIQDGFAAGIRTNDIYFSMAKWIEEKATENSSDGDFALVMEQTPMGYMLAKRRPAINHSWTGLAKSSELRIDSINLMIKEKRFPKIAFRFVQEPLFMPVSLKDETFNLASRRKFNSSDPIAGYIETNMTLTDTFTAYNEVWVEFYIDNKK